MNDYIEYKGKQYYRNPEYGYIEVRCQAKGAWGEPGRVYWRRLDMEGPTAIKVHKLFFERAMKELVV